MTHGTKSGRIPQHSIAVLRAVDGVDASFGIFLASKGHIDTNRLLMLCILLGFAHNDLQDLAVLTKVVIAAQRLEQFVFTYCRRETRDVH